MKEADVFGYTLTEEGKVFNKNGYEMTIGVNYKGYPHVTLFVDGKVKTFTMHRLMAKSFIPNPDNLSDVDHIDGDRSNFSLENLRWITHGENIKHSYDSGRRCAKGVNNANAKLSEYDVRTVCILLAEGLSCADVHKSTGLSKPSIYNIKKRKHWKDISRHYKW